MNKLFRRDPSHPPLPCRASPPQGGRSAVSAPRSLLPRWRLAKAVERSISPLAGEMAGRPEGGAVPPHQRVCTANPHSLAYGQIAPFLAGCSQPSPRGSPCAS
ncbi:MAG: hypothetical protein E5Y01_32480 [Mesorhizobium sp.]|nr:MAG: hypothetical protein EOR75_32995 [Mesorhizobium sp.]TJV47521.1 MAG: hypothetical protein E5Y01_32480 [Mesorhizobium sp.]